MSISVNVKVAVAVVLGALCFQTAREIASRQADQAPAVVGVALDIPGVVKGGTKIERIKEGFNGLDDPIGLMDGTLAVPEPRTRRIHRMDTGTNHGSVLVAEANESHGVT